MRFADTWEMIFTILVWFIILLEVVIVFGAVKATAELLQRGHHYLRCLILILLLLMISCATPNHPKTHKPLKGKAYKTNRGLMLLENTQLGRNKYYWSNANQRRIKSYHKRHK
jgi:hypothetical protein